MTTTDPAEASPSAGAATPAGRRWRIPRGLVAIAALTCATVVLTGHIRGDGDGPGSGVEVVETGFSILEVPSHDLNYGVVIENRSDRVAYHTVACVHVDIDRDEDRYGDTEAGCQRFTVEVLLPGQRVGFGDAGYPLHSGEDVTGISVEVRGPATWEDPDDPDDDQERGAIIATDLAVAYSPEDEPVVSFDRESTYDRVAVRNASAYALLRDVGGKIVGASGVDLEEPVLPHELVRLSILFGTPVPDVATAEVYVFPSGL